MRQPTKAEMAARIDAQNHKISQLTTDLESSQRMHEACRKDLFENDAALRAEIAALRAEIQELRTTTTKVRNARTLETIRDRMAAAKAEALRTGRCVKVAA